ncbi:hypothetical protein PR048_012289 [Dryococelus australis]|uniref:Retrotransposon Copia-like N-terminal domain-containing protein n=1 Tax=Dryococelus australis TaxID=614101 RepID=A0ABQ9HP03_9NEOP|nr:hypothetical protein PR048_012289 [Dryococelus australis]
MTIVKVNIANAIADKCNILKLNGDNYYVWSIQAKAAIASKILCGVLVLQVRLTNMEKCSSRSHQWLCTCVLYKKDMYNGKRSMGRFERYAHDSGPSWSWCKSSIATALITAGELAKIVCWFTVCTGRGGVSTSDLRDIVSFPTRSQQVGKGGMVKMYVQGFLPRGTVCLHSCSWWAASSLKT